MPGRALSALVGPEPMPKRSPAYGLWAVLIARFLRPCGTDRSYAQRTSSVPNCLRVPVAVSDLRQPDTHPYAHQPQGRHTTNSGAHRGADRATAHHPKPGPRLSEGCDAPPGKGMGHGPNWVEAAQPAPDFKVDQRTCWQGKATVIWPTLFGRLGPPRLRSGNTNKPRATGPQQPLQSTHFRGFW